MTRLDPNPHRLSSLDVNRIETDLKREGDRAYRDAPSDIAHLHRISAAVTQARKDGVGEDVIAHVLKRQGLVADMARDDGAIVVRFLDQG